MRDCARHESLTKLVLQSPNIWKFFKFVEVPTFDVASDSFATFKVEIFLSRKVDVSLGTSYKTQTYRC